jgi:hypothetical protein
MSYCQKRWDSLELRCLTSSSHGKKVSTRRMAWCKPGVSTLVELNLMSWIRVRGTVHTETDKRPALKSQLILLLFSHIMIIYYNIN